MTTVSSRYLELAALSRQDLEQIFATGSAPELAALAGYEFRGYNQPRATALLGIRKFIKAFWTDSAQASYGCNTPVTQNGLSGEWLPKPSQERPKRYAFFQVGAASPDSADELRRKAVLLDYSLGPNPPWHAARILRDYVVRVEPGSDDLLLGKAFFVVAGKRLAESFFLIERFRPLADAADLAARTSKKG